MFDFIFGYTGLVGVAHFPTLFVIARIDSCAQLHSATAIAPVTQEANDAIFTSKPNQLPVR
jgi:hypothetical protein